MHAESRPAAHGHDLASVLRGPRVLGIESVFAQLPVITQRTVIVERRDDAT